MRENIDFEECPHCGVGKSKISGQGLFALKLFKQGEVVADYMKSSKLWKKCSFKNIPQQYQETCWWVGQSRRTALLARAESPFMRANHSRNPNTLWDPQKMKLIALKSIQPGEEITYDYRREIAPNYLKSKPPIWA
jgi:SET domain-containing protein